MTTQPLLFPTNETFWYETLRAFGHIAYGGADFGEVMVTSARIKPGDYNSWFAQWQLTADRVAAEAERSLTAGHTVSARDGFLRASNYYRTAEFFLHGDPKDPRMNLAYYRSVECFRAAARLMNPTVEPLRIPYEGTTLPGYFYRAGSGREARPLVVMHNGFDGSAEEMHFVAAAALVDRGYNVLSFDGPGQPGPMHERELVFRPDWENVVGPVLDHALARPEVDRDRVALLGNSLGGLLAPRAAAYENRIAALVALDGIYDMGAKAAAILGGDREHARRVLGAPEAPDVDAALARIADTDSQARWAFDHGMWVTGTRTPRHYLLASFDYHVRDGIAERIACPTLVCSAADDHFFRGQPEALFERLQCPKTFLELTDELGAGAHCHAGGQRLAMTRIGDWLDDTLRWSTGSDHSERM